MLGSPLVLAVFLVLSMTFGYSSMTGSRMLSEFGVTSDAQLEAQAHILGLALSLSGFVSLSVIRLIGEEDAAKRRLQAFMQLCIPILACCGFMVVGPSLMLLNKHIMQEEDFPYPLSLSSVGMVASSLVARLAVFSGAAFVRKESADVVAGANYWSIVFPIAALRAVTLATGNAVYLYLSLGFIQMLKAFTPALILLVMYFLGVSPPTRAAQWCVIIIVMGTLVEVQGEMHATTIGLALMMTSCLCEAATTVMTQKLMQNFRFNEMETMYYLALPSVLILAVPTIFLEWSKMAERGRYNIFLDRPLMMLAAAFLGVGVNFLTLMVVRATSSITVKILNTLRCIGLVLVGALFYGEVHSGRQILGYGASLVGFIGYNYFQLSADGAQAVEAWMDGLVASVCGCRSAPAPNEFRKPRSKDSAAYGVRSLHCETHVPNGQ